MEAKKNPTLSDVMNAIINSISRGRQAADFEAMRSAVNYQRIELLKGIPVPRMRINNVKVSIPMILNAVVPAMKPEHVPISEISSKAKAVFKEEIQVSLNWMKSGIKLLSNNESKKNVQLKYLKAFTKIFQQVNNPNKNSYAEFENDLNQRLEFELNMYKLSMNEMINEQGIKDVIDKCIESSLLLVIKNEILIWVKERVKQKEQDSEEEEPLVFDIDRANNSTEDKSKNKIVAGLLKKVKLAILSKCIKVREQGSELEVLVDTESIKNSGGGPDSVTRLNFVIREEGLEWVTEVNDDKISTHSLVTE